MEAELTSKKSFENRHFKKENETLKEATDSVSVLKAGLAYGFWADYGGGDKCPGSHPPLENQALPPSAL